MMASFRKKLLTRKIRGIRMISEIYTTDLFEWKVFSQKLKLKLTDHFEVLHISFLDNIEGRKIMNPFPDASLYF